MTARIVRAEGIKTPVVMAIDDAPTYGFDYIETNDIPVPVVFMAVASQDKHWRVTLSPHSALLGVISWASHMLSRGMTTPYELGARLSTVPGAEYLAQNMLEQMPASMVQRLFESQRRRIDL